MPETAASTPHPAVSAPGAAVELSVVIPAFNEAARLPVFLDSVIEWCGKHQPDFEVIVVDDGSSDETAQLAGQRNARVISHLKNAGKGAAVRTGMLAAKGRLRLFADADGATTMDELPALIAAGGDVAIGSREGADKLVQCSPLRRFLGRWFNRMVRMGSVKGIRDTQCGFKLFATKQAQALFEIAQEDGFAFDVELLLVAQRKGLSITEVFVNWTEIPGSKVRLFRDGWRMLKAVRRIKKRWRSGEYERAAVRVTPGEVRSAQFEVRS
jgi:dolichyl-phosphate beta-glucosyltransferase